ncbi:acetate kinase [Planctomicrobium piriforme]|uniref:Acetate kinase n=2 Tax=Planctomicrobium piriforme TaxID=1576369 RepID=A0A1I3B4L4_9PLAN|nr:acetate kinase [Planctomicrobium piriforme]
MPEYLLTINTGSSSVKFAVYSFEPDAPPAPCWQGSIDRLLPSPKNAGGTTKNVFEQLLEWISAHLSINDIVAVGHRMVHGGPRCHSATWLDNEKLDYLTSCIPLAPNHLPSQLELIWRFLEKLPDIPQAGCFDTAFHAGLPRVASLLPIPRAIQGDQLRRYGFHGLSYAYLMEELQLVAGTAAANGKVILAHLGNGASMAAVRQGKSLDTSMSLTPAAGLVMGTRTGDVDPGLLLYLLRQRHMTVEQLDRMVTWESGLLGVSETSSDMRDLLKRRETDVRAAEAVDLFCYQARKLLGAYAAAMGGLDTVVFSGGIGEHAPEVRRLICQQLEFFGIKLDNAKNLANAGVISAADAKVKVRVIPTNEEIMIAREVKQLLTADRKN